MILGTEDIEKMLMRICDRPGCGNEIPDGTGAGVEVYIRGPILSAEGTAVLDADGSDPTLALETDYTVDWQVCDECKVAILLANDPDRIKKMISGLRAAASRKANKEAKTPEDPAAVDPVDPVAEEELGTPNISTL